MVHPVIISQGSAWSGSVLCAEADAERAERDEIIAKGNRKIRRANARAWRRHGLHIGSAFVNGTNDGRGKWDRENPSKPRVKHGPTIAEQRVMERGKSILELLKKHEGKELTLLDIQDAVSDCDRLGVERAMHAHIACGRITKRFGPNPRHGLIEDARPKCNLYRLAATAPADSRA